MQTYISKQSLLLSALFILPLTFAVTLPATASAPQQDASTLDHCYALIGAKPRTELANCLQEQQQNAEKELEQQLEKTRRELEETGSSAIKTAIQSLEKSQQAFLQFREAECKRIGDAALGGSGAGDMQQACITDLTHWRIRQLAE